MSGIDIGFTQGPQQIQCSRGLFSLEAPPATFTIGGSSAVKWFPGHYLNVNKQVNKDSGSADYSAINLIQPYIGTGPNTGIQYTGVQGLSMMCYWGYLETGTLGQYNFGGNTAPSGGVPDIDQILSQCAGMSPQRTFALCLNLGNPDWDNDRYTPTYITTNSTYGAAQAGSSGNPTSGVYGVYATSQGGASGAANFQNANVMARIKALILAIATAYDTNPLFAHFRLASTDIFGPAGGTYSYSSVFSNYLEIAQYAQSVFLHTPVGVAWGFNIVQSYEVTATQALIMPGSSDISGATAWTATYMPLSYICNGGSGTWSSAPTGASGTLTGGYYFNGYEGTAVTGTYSCPMAFSDGTTVTASFTQGSSTVTWTPSLGAATKSTTGTTVSFNPLWATTGTQTYLNYGGPSNNNWTPLGTPLYTYIQGAWDIEPEDLSGGAGAPYPGVFTPADICNALNNNLYGAFAFWWGLGGIYPSDNGYPTADWTTSVVPAIQAAPLTNTTYPY